MQSTDPRQPAASPVPPAKARLLMQQDRTGRGLLDGGWWPRTNDPAAELPGLIPELDERHGRVIRIMLGTRTNATALTGGRTKNTAPR